MHPFYSTLDHPEDLPKMATPSSRPRLLGIVSLIFLAVQNSTLALVLHASRMIPIGEIPGAQVTYYAPAVVLLTEVLKTMICAAFVMDGIVLDRLAERSSKASRSRPTYWLHFLHPYTMFTLLGSVLTSSAWTLLLPAVLYTVQNNLQYTAAENLEPAIFQTLYQLKVLTTAFWSRALLGKRITTRQWIALALLAIGIAIVQVSSVDKMLLLRTLAGEFDEALRAATRPPPISVAELEAWTPEIDDSPSDPLPLPKINLTNPKLGFAAVLLACLTSGLAGVWFEKVLKQPSGTQNSIPSGSFFQHHADQGRHDEEAAEVSKANGTAKQPGREPVEKRVRIADYVEARTVHPGDSPQMLFSRRDSDESSTTVVDHEPLSPTSLSARQASAPERDLWIRSLQLSLFSLIPAALPVILKVWSEEGDIMAPWRGFGAWAWTIVWLQTLGGLLIACVMKWADNILKCFAIAFALLLTCLLSVPLFHFELTSPFLFGACLTLVSVFLYQISWGAKIASFAGLFGQFVPTDERDVGLGGHARAPPSSMARK